MKKKINLFIIAICLLFIPGMVKADQIGINFECPDSVKSNSTFTCTMKIEPGGVDVTTVRATFTLPSGFTYSSFKP